MCSTHLFWAVAMSPGMLIFWSMIIGFGPLLVSVFRCMQSFAFCMSDVYMISSGCLFSRNSRGNLISLWWSTYVWQIIFMLFFVVTVLLVS